MMQHSPDADKNHAVLFKIENLSKNYQLGENNLVTALKNVSFTLQGEGIVALMGPSGSGKSTLLNLLGTLDTPSSGQIYFRGKDISSLTRDDKARFRNTTAGFVFQNFNLIPILTTFENVVLPSQLSSGFNQNEVKERAEELLSKVGLSKQAHQSVNKLSGGQMQRVSLARALINKPEVIFADEPTANLDHQTSEKILQVLRNLCQSEKTTVLVATHDHAVLEYCDRILTLRDGELIKDTNQ